MQISKIYSNQAANLLDVASINKLRIDPRALRVAKIAIPILVLAVICALVIYKLYERYKIKAIKPQKVEDGFEDRSAPGFFDLKFEKPVSTENTATAKKYGLECPPNNQAPFELAPTKFVDKILKSDLYSKNEKEELFQATTRIYVDDHTSNTPVTPTTWVEANVTRKYLEHLSLKRPNFRVLGWIQACVNMKTRH